MCGREGQLAGRGGRAPSASSNRCRCSRSHSALHGSRLLLHLAGAGAGAGAGGDLDERSNAREQHNKLER